jgi:hypothetical protein
MGTDTHIRNKILKKVSQIPSDRLKELDEFVSNLEKQTDKKTRNLSFAGSWSNIDDSTLKELTDNLISNRQKNRRRIDG